MTGHRPDPADEAGSPAGRAPGGPLDRIAAADLADRYERMRRLAALFDAAGDELRRRADLGAEVLADPDVAESAELAPRTWELFEEDVRAATAGRHGLLGRSTELDADSLVVRATVNTYRWIDQLQQVAYDTLGSIAGRAIGFLAPEVALGGAVVSAGLIETDALDRDGVAAYLEELAESNPELLEHVTRGGGLLDGLQLRALLTVGALAADSGPQAARGGMRAIGSPRSGTGAGAGFDTGFAAALRDIAGDLVGTGEDRDHADGAPPAAEHAAAPATLEALVAALLATRRSVDVRRVAPGRYLVLLPGPEGGSGRRLRLVGGDPRAYTAQAVRAITAAVAEDADPRLLVIGRGQGGLAAVEMAAAEHDEFRIDQVVTAGAPGAQAASVPEPTHVLALEDRRDPVVLLGSLLNAGRTNRVTVVFDGGDSPEADYLAGGRAADRSDHPDLLALLERLRERGFLSP